MADEVQRLEEENASLREEIEKVQQERRAGFADGAELSRAVTAHEENERLKLVLAAQRRVLEREEQARESLLSDEPTLNAEGLPVDMPYTYTEDGIIVSDPVVVDEGDKAEEASADTAEAPVTSNADRLSRLVAPNTGDDAADDENKEN